MKSVDEQIEDILRREGGFVNNPADKGGATNHGISLRYARGIGLDLDRDGDVDKDDICIVSPALAAELFKRDFLETPRINRLPDEIQPQMFDIAVNSGPHRAIELLQMALNRFGCQLVEDGRFGSKTRRAAEQEIEARGWETVNNALVDERVDYFRRVVKRDGTQSRFLRGWLVRAEEFRA